MDSFERNTERAFGLLFAAARSRSTVTYTQLAEAFGVSVVELRGSLAEMLGKIAEESLAELGVALPILVVSKKDNMPSKGFFTWAEENGFDISNPHKLVLDEQRKVFDKFATLTLA